MKHLLLFTTILLLSSCSQDEEIQTPEDIVTESLERSYSSDEIRDFFELGEIPTGSIKKRSSEWHMNTRVANEVLYEMETLEPFLADFILEYGMPCWECAYTHGDGSSPNATIPLFKGDRLEGIFLFAEANDNIITFTFNDVDFIKRVSKFENSPQIVLAKGLIKIFEMQAGITATIPQTIESRNECSCSGLQVPTGIGYDDDDNLIISTNIPLSFCFCFDWTDPNPDNETDFLPVYCCNQDGIQLDNGWGEAGTDGENPSDYFNNWEDWIEYTERWQDYIDRLIRIGGGEPIVKPNLKKKRVLLLQQTQNEQFVLNTLIDLLNLPVGEWDGQPQYWQVLADNPHISNPIFLYLNNFYPDVTPSIQNVMDLLELLSIYELENNPPISLGQTQIEHILTFEPELINDVKTFLDNHPNDAVAIQVIKDLLDLQMCVNKPVCDVTSYPNSFELFLTFYKDFSLNDYNWLQASIDFITQYGLDSNLPNFLNTIMGSCNSCTDYNSFREYSAKIIAIQKHEYLLTEYEDYSIANVDIQAFIVQYGADAYLASSTMYETFVNEVGEAPDDPYQWQLAMEVFQEELAPILLEFVPGVGDLIGAYNDFKDGSYFWGCVGIVAAIVPGDEVIKVIRKADNIRDAWKKVKKIFTLWNKLFSTIGGQRILNKMPQSWKDLPGSKLADGNGLFWRKDQFNNLRMMDANPNSMWPS